MRASATDSRQEARLLRRGDAEIVVGRIRLVAVLVQPDLLVAVEPGHLGDERVEVAEGDRRRAGRSRRRRLRRAARIRMVSVGVEAGGTGALHRPQKRDRRGRRPFAQRCVVAAGTGVAAGDLLAGDQRAAHAVDDRVADARVVDRALDHPVLADALPLRHEADRQVGLVPRRPVAHPRQHGPVVAHELAAVALRGGEREVDEVGGAMRRARRQLPAVRPGRRAEDREENLHVLVGCTQDDLVVAAPVVRRVARIGAVDRAARRDAELAAPVQMDAQHLGVQPAEVGIERRRRREVGVAAVGDAELQPGGGRRSCGARGRQSDERKRQDPSHGQDPASKL